MNNEQLSSLAKSISVFDARSVDSHSSRSDLYAARGWDAGAARAAMAGDAGAFNRPPPARRAALLTGNGPL